jgi:hypothetical protein
LANPLSRIILAINDNSKPFWVWFLPNGANLCRLVKKKMKTLLVLHFISHHGYNFGNGKGQYTRQTVQEEKARTHLPYS